MTTPPVVSVTDELIAQLEQYSGVPSIAALLAERAELKRDADRYRWLRDDTSKGKIDLLICSKFWGNGKFKTQERILTGVSADAAIDAAMQS